MPQKVAFQVRMPKEWYEQVDATIRELPPPPGGDPITRASFVREAIETETLLWRRSPYVCKQSKNYVLVNRFGDFLFHRREQLQLNADLRGIPSHLEMRLGKRRGLKKGQDPWGLNAFALHRGDQVQAATDPNKDLSSKTVTFPGMFPEGAQLTREGCFLLQDYVQRRKEKAPANLEQGLDSLYDRTEFEIDIPTRVLEALVVVDLRLYDGYPPSEGEPTLRFGVRNRDGVGFSNEDVVGHFQRQSSLIHIGSPPAPESDPLHQETVQRIREEHRDFREGLERLRRELPGEEVRSRIDRALERLDLPERFLFYRVSWTGAHIGLICSVRFPRPFDRRP